MPKTVVLFLCSGNAAGSQMAEGFLRELGGDRFETHSAGLDPIGVHRLAVEVLREFGIDISGQRSKSLTEYLGKQPAQYVIFVCERADKSCPKVWPFALATMCWPFRDPAAAQDDNEAHLQTFREARDEIQGAIESWLATNPQVPHAATR
jgi:arsenate reductase